MIRVEPKPLRDYVVRGDSGLVRHIDASVFNTKRHLLSPGLAAFGFALVFGLLAFGSRTALILFLTEIIVLSALFLRTRKIANSLSIRRKIPRIALREMDEIDVVLEVQNRSSYSLPTLIIDDRVGVSRDPVVRLAPDCIKPRSLTRLKYRRRCDAGMGNQRIGPLTMRLTDPLGIFEFRIIEDSILEIEVYPRVEKAAALPVRASVDSIRYGNYEVVSRGISVNFSGVRPYSLGDSLRHVAWKLSMRGQGLLVKEFERVVNCDVSVVLNFERQWQVGRDSSSTWEYSKDAALAVVQQQIELGNTVGFFSQASFVEPAVGDDQFHLITRHIARLRLPSEEEIDLQAPPVLARFRDFYARGSNIVYITPFNIAELEKSGPWLKRLRAEGFQVICIFIDTDSFWAKFLESISPGLLLGRQMLNGRDEAMMGLQEAGVDVRLMRT